MGCFSSKPSASRYEGGYYRSSYSPSPYTRSHDASYEVSIEPPRRAVVSSYGSHGSTNASYGGYQVRNSGVNDRGNYYESRDYGSGARNQNAYVYHNKDGSYYSRNPDGSSYYNNGRGYSRHTPAY